MSPSPAPADANIRSTYPLGPEDQIIVRCLDAEEISEKPVQVGTDGFISLPMIGRVHAEGLTAEQLEADLTGRLKTYIKDPHVAVSITEFRSHPASVLGAVNTPGVQQIRGNRTLLEVVSGAGGLRPDAGHSIKITRQLRWGALPLPNAANDASGQFSTGEISVERLMQAKSPADNIPIKPNDVISVPKADMVYVIGEVTKAGGFVLKEREHISVLQALALAEGLTKMAGPKGARILREAPNSPNRTEIAVNIQKIIEGSAPDVPLSRDDILFIPKNLSRSVSLKALENAVNLGTGILIWRR